MYRETDKLDIKKYSKWYKHRFFAIGMQPFLWLQPSIKARFTVPRQFAHYMSD